MDFRPFLLLACLALTACATLQTGDESSTGRSAAARWPEVGIRGGAALLSGFDSDVRLDSKTLGRGTDINLEDELGLKSDTGIARADLWWRLDDARRSRIELSWFDIRRTGTRQIQRDIQFGDRIFSIDTEIGTYFNTAVIKANYRYNFYVSDDAEIGASLGIHGIGLDIGLSENDLSAERSFDAPVPLPVAGLHGEWLALDRLRLLASTEALYIRVNDIGGAFGTQDLEGYLLDARAGIEWEPIDHLGIGVGYNFFQLNADFGGDLLALSTDYRYSGLLLYGTLSF